MTMLIIDFDMDLEGAIALLSQPESPLAFTGRLPKRQDMEQTYTFKFTQYDQTYLLTKQPMNGTIIPANQAGSELGFRQKMSLYTLEIRSIHEQMVASAQQISSYLLDNDVPRYVMIRMAGVMEPYRVVGGLNPRTGQRIVNSDLTEELRDIWQIAPPPISE